MLVNTLTVKASSQYNATQCIAFAVTLIGTQYDTRIELDPILAFLCCIQASDHQKVTKMFNFAFRKLTQCKALCHSVKVHGY